MLLYDYDSNAIMINPFKKDITKKLVRSQTRIIKYLLDQLLKPAALCIENDCPEVLQSFLGQTVLMSIFTHQTTAELIN